MKRAYQVILRVEHGAHDVMVVPSEYADAGARLPIPDPDCLVVRG